MLRNIIKSQLDGKSEEHQYLNLIKDILSEGEMVEGRNGLTKSVFGASMLFSLKDGTIPILTTKRVAWKTCLRELFWFIRGSTSNEELQKSNVKIWNANASREFLDSRGLTNLRENDLGPVYGHQWRFFNAEYKDCDTDYTGKGVDQLKYIIDNLRSAEGRTSRRLILSAWNPCQLDEMALPPCHVLMQFNVIGNKLSCSLYQRSGDVGLGVPFNIASYSFLTHIIAHYCGLEADEFVYNLGNAHIYDDHLESLEQQCQLTPYEFPKITIEDRDYANIEDYKEEDFTLHNYQSHAAIKMEMRK
ncbi:MAG: thymidylate synthase [Candidatus Thorarchaeota archaeon]|jgi:thymidylate synthase